MYRKKVREKTILTKYSSLLTAATLVKPGGFLLYVVMMKSKKRVLFWMNRNKE